ncbi:site-specific integrase [Microbacterium phyllosphaerae]|uniref:site-specific integrase n=1 Tax=Microbacterium phyllosphaerae TaxID=124798 RepID=UPI00142E01CF|nr:site-specific integrase [Microbacterium phyllosphaerae]
MRVEIDESSAAPVYAGLLKAHEEVLAGRFQRDSTAPRALYGDESVTAWSLVSLGVPASEARTWGKINFGELRGEWLTTAKDLAVVCLNPEHPSFVSRNLTRSTRKPQQPATVGRYVAAIRDYHAVARWGGYPASLADWEPDDYEEALVTLERAGAISADRLENLERVPRLLHSLREVIPGAPGRALWASPRLSPFADRLGDRGQRDELKTAPVEPKVYYALLDAALAYVTVFATDIIECIGVASRYKERPSRSAGEPVRSRAARFDAYFTRPTTRIPMHRIPAADASDDVWLSAINWQMVAVQALGEVRSSAYIVASFPAGRARRALALSLARQGRHEIGGLFAPNARLEGRRVPWASGLSPNRLAVEIRMLRSACYIVIAALTMMRDSEVQELRRGCLTSYMGTPAVRSELIKGEDQRPSMHWWISEPVADAVRVLEKISTHPTHLFASSMGGAHNGVGIAANLSLAVFRKRINATIDQTGLAPIPEGHVAPHMLRRTMALLTERERGGQLAARHQLKHAYRASRSNSLTGAYTAQSDIWAGELHERQVEADARDILDELALAPTNRPVGPGASRVKTALRGSGVVLDRKAKARLLAQDFPDLRIGTANVCLGDRSLAACLTVEEREGSVEVRPTACDPTRCANSVLLPRQEPMWLAEEASVASMLAEPRLSPHARASLKSRMEELKMMTRHVK